MSLSSSVPPIQNTKKTCQLTKFVIVAVVLCLFLPLQQALFLQSLPPVQSLSSQEGNENTTTTIPCYVAPNKPTTYTPPNLCRKPRIHFPKDPTSAPGSDTNNDPAYSSMYMSFQCGGEEYYHLGHNIQQFHIEKTWPKDQKEQQQQQQPQNQNNDKQQEVWGSRKVPIPTTQGKRILIIGNSHTRQQVEAFLCQYEDWILYGTLFPVPSKKDIGNEGMVHLRINNNNNNNNNNMNTNMDDDLNNTTTTATPPTTTTTTTTSTTPPPHHHHTIRWLCNHPFAYAGTSMWKQMLEQYTQTTLEKDWDLIILGRFNQHQESKGTRFYQHLLALSREQNSTIDFENNKPPTTIDFANVFSGPIIKATSFDQVASRRDNQIYLQEVQQIQIEMKRPNVMFLDARQYMPLLGEGRAPGSKGEVNECFSDVGPGHRCQGPYGGIPDLFVWDLVELLHQLLS